MLWLSYKTGVSYLDLILKKSFGKQIQCSCLDLQHCNSEQNSLTWRELLNLPNYTQYIECNTFEGIYVFNWHLVYVVIESFQIRDPEVQGLTSVFFVDT